MERVVTIVFPVFLIFLQQHVLTSQVDPATNLTLSCRNLRNILTWSYDKQPPGLEFKVLVHYISGDPTILQVTPPPLKADLSFLSESNQDYYVTVIAVVEGTESASSKGILFSYFKDSPVPQKCFVDLPSVNVTTPKQDIIKFSFVHPWLFHKQNLSDGVKPGTKKRRNHDPQLPEFEYWVVFTNQTEKHRFRCVESMCEETLPVNPTQEPHCLEINGDINKMSVKATQDYCATPFVAIAQGENNYIYIIVACVFLGIMLIIICMVVVKKTKAPSTLPDAFHFGDHQTQLTLGINKEQVSVLEVEPSSPTPLLPVTDTTEHTSVPVPDLDGRYPIGLPVKDEGVCEDEEVQDAGESEYMQGRHFEDGDTEEIHCGYETRPVLTAIAPDELAQGYRA